MLIMMVYAVLMKYWSSGPQWPQEQDAYSTYCNESWWTNLLYVNNLVKVKKMVGSHFRQSSLTLCILMDFSIHIVIPRMGPSLCTLMGNR